MLRLCRGMFDPLIDIVPGVGLSKPALRACSRPAAPARWSPSTESTSNCHGGDGGWRHPPRVARRPTIASAFRRRSPELVRGLLGNPNGIQFNPPLLSSPHLSPPRKSSLPPPRNLAPDHTTRDLPPSPSTPQPVSQPPTHTPIPTASVLTVDVALAPPRRKPPPPQRRRPCYLVITPASTQTPTAALKTAAAAVAAAAAGRRAAAAVVRPASVESHPPSG